MTRRIFMVFVLLGTIAGCHAPMPAFKPLIPYGPTRIPPPGTGSFGTPDPYYQPPASGEPAAGAAPMGAPATGAPPRGARSGVGLGASDADRFAGSAEHNGGEPESDLVWSAPQPLPSQGPSRPNVSNGYSILAPTPAVRDADAGVPPSAVVPASYDGYSGPLEPVSPTHRRGPSIRRESGDHEGWKSR